MRSHRLHIILVASLLGGASCGEVTGPRDDGDPPITTASPPPGAYLAVPTVTLTTNEPATIYYTVDGSEPSTDSASAPGSVELRDVEADTPVRFFAVDTAGNQEEPQEALYGLGAGPDPVENLRAEAVGVDVTVSWDAVADGDHVLLVRLAGPPELPERGAAYAMGDLALGGEVVYVGTGTSFADEDLVPGAAAYAAYAIDTAGDPSRGTVASVEIPLPIQTIALTIETGTPGTVEVTGEPTDIGVSATINSNQSTATQPVVNLRMTNRTSRVLYVPKLVLRRAEAEAVAIDPVNITKRKGQANRAADGTVPAAASFYYIDPLPNGWAPGSTRSIQLVIANQVDGSTIELELEILPSRMLVTYSGFDDLQTKGGALADLVGRKYVGDLAIRVTGPGQDYGYRPGVFSIDGRYLYLASRNSPEITTYDLVTMGETQTARVNGEHGKSHVQQIVPGRDGRTLYALFNDGAHSFHDLEPGDSSRAELPIHVELVAIDRVTWKELARVRLATRSGAGDFMLRGRRFALSPDGTRAVVTVSSGLSDDADDELTAEDRGSVHIVELATMTEIDTDPDRDGVQAIALDEVPVVGGGGDTVVVNPSWPTFVGDDLVLVGPSTDNEYAPNDTITAAQNVIVELDLTDYRVRGVTIGTDADEVRRVSVVGDHVLVHGGGEKLWRYDVEERTAEDVGWIGNEVGHMLASGPNHVLMLDGQGGNVLRRISLVNGAEDWNLPLTGSLYGMALTPY